jgi:hypothetical protein
MAAVSGFPYFEVEFTKEGEVHDPDQVRALRNALKPGDPTDLLVISHGWNNDMAEARDLYIRFLGSFRKRLDAGFPGVQGRKFAVMGVLWPSKKFAEKEFIPSGAAGTSAIPDRLVLEELESLKGVFGDSAAAGAKADADIEKAKGLVPKLENSPAARKEFADLLRGLVPRDSGAPQDGADAAPDFFKLDGEEVMKRLEKPAPISIPSAGQGPAAGLGGAAAGPGMGGPGAGQGGAAFLGPVFSGIKSAAMKLLNLTTYYQMKNRAGVVGAKGLSPILRGIRSQFGDIRIHVVGHSFGGRLVTAATLALGKSDLQPSASHVDSMGLLQAAFSHYGFAQKWDGKGDGAFRKVLTEKLVRGPVVLTCTSNDKAVGLAYPIASLTAGQVAAGLGDKHDKYGGIGRNGAQKTPEAADLKLLAVGKAYELQAGRIHNLLADEFVKSHSDVGGEEVAYAVLAAIART